MTHRVGVRVRWNESIFLIRVSINATEWCSQLFNDISMIMFNAFIRFWHFDVLFTRLSFFTSTNRFRNKRIKTRRFSFETIHQLHRNDRCRCEMSIFLINLISTLSNVGHLAEHWCVRKASWNNYWVVEKRKK